jgi:outer membrane murein-binding lipoprotein Lpp
MRRLLPIPMAAAAVLAAGCGIGSGPAYFVGNDGTAVALITWSAPHSGRAVGTLTADTLTGAAPSETVKVQTVPVTVRFSGRTMSFSGSGLDALAGATITGTLSGRTLRISAPYASGYLDSAVLRTATPAVFNLDVATLRARASHDNTVAKQEQPRQQLTAQVASDQQQVASDVSTLQTDIGTLSSDMSQMNTDVQQTSTDLAQLKSDAANGAGPSCENVATVDSDATTVDSDGMTAGNDATTVTADISTVQSDISQLTGDLATLKKDGGTPAGDPSPPTVLSQAQTAVTNALSQANSYISTVNGYLQQAYTTANNLSGGTCASSG